MLLVGSIVRDLKKISSLPLTVVEVAYTYDIDKIALPVIMDLGYVLIGKLVYPAVEESFDLS